MPLDAIKEFPIVCNKLSVDTMLNVLKSVDHRLLEPIPDIETTIFFQYECEIHIVYKYNNHEVSVCIASTYVIIHEKNNSIMMYEGDGEKLSVKERLFSTIMDILNRYRGEING